jgi:hypothetical protein
MSKSHWNDWLERGERDYVMMGAFLGDKDARALVPDTPVCPATLAAFVDGVKGLPWGSTAAESPYHKILVRIAVALGRAVLPIARQMNEVEAAPEVLYTTEAWLVWPKSFVTTALERLFFTSPGPDSPREFQMQFDVGGVALSPKHIDAAVKRAVKILGAKEAYRVVIEELRAFLVECDDPVERSIGTRVFLCLTIYDEKKKEAKVNKFPPGWESPVLEAGGPVPTDRAFKATAGEWGELLPNSKELFLVSDRFRKLIEEHSPDLEFVECAANGRRFWWVRPRVTRSVMAKNCIAFSERRFLMLDANKCAKAPAVFFVKENPVFVCADVSFISAYYRAGLKGLFATVLPFGVPLARREKAD